MTLLLSGPSEPNGAGISFVLIKDEDIKLVSLDVLVDKRLKKNTNVIFQRAQSRLFLSILERQ